MACVGSEISVGLIPVPYQAINIGNDRWIVSPRKDNS